MEPLQKSVKKQTTTTTAAADTSSEIAKKIKDQFRSKVGLGGNSKGVSRRGGGGGNKEMGRYKQRGSEENQGSVS